MLYIVWVADSGEDDVPMAPHYVGESEEDARTVLRNMTTSVFNDLDKTNPEMVQPWEHYHGQEGHGPLRSGEAGGELLEGFSCRYTYPWEGHPPFGETCDVQLWRVRSLGRVTR